MARAAEIDAALADEDAAPVPLQRGKWRIEVMQAGKFYQWRQGSGKSRRSVYGGKFSQLSAERQNQYRQRRANRQGGGA